MMVDLFESKLQSVFHNVRNMLREWHIYSFGTRKELADTLSGCVFHRKRAGFPVVVIGPDPYGWGKFASLFVDHEMIVVRASHKAMSSKHGQDELRNVIGGTEVLLLERASDLPYVLMMAKELSIDQPVNVVSLLPSHALYKEEHFIRMVHFDHFAKSLASVLNGKHYVADMDKYLRDLILVFDKAKFHRLEKVNFFFYLLQKDDQFKLHSNYPLSQLLFCGIN
jgi:hypothetical protein